MAILKIGSDNDYLLDYKHDRIQKGLGIGCRLDNHLVFKRGQYVGVLGGNNVGKTYLMAWYFLCLSVHHGLRFGLWMDENKKGRVMRDLIQWYSGRTLKSLDDDEIIHYAEIVERSFFFIDNSKIYKSGELMDLLESGKPDGVLLDPFNQLDRPVGYAENIEFVRGLKHWCKTKDITLYLTMHPKSESGRKSHEYPKGHDWEGQQQMPNKHNAEGGSLFSNMADDWINLNRFNKLESMKYYTMVDVDKVKDVDTGGSMTLGGFPIMLHFNNGLGFKIDGVNPLESVQNKPIEPEYKTNSLNGFNIKF
tara:strand:+ start:3070 stop:3990 length:921 start_codon:yes stop_codon:yes gene_type:complete